MGKWLGALIGFLVFRRFWGAFFGYLIGSFFDASVTVTRTTRRMAGSSPFAGDRNGFLYALMVLSAHIIHADGRIMHSEMEALRRFLSINFGEATKQQGEQIILRIFQQKKTMSAQEWRQYIQQSAMQMSLVLSPEQRLQLLAYLMEVAKSDSTISSEELTALREVAVLLRMNAGVIDQMMGLGRETLEDAYRVLGVTPQSTDDEIRRAYKKMALDNHPDRVASLGEDVRRAAEKKFKEINEAKERIFKSRGMK